MALDHYRTLGLEPDATLTRIKQQFRQLVLEAHPDRALGNAARLQEAERRTRALIAAYRVLAHRTRRESYDAQRAQERLDAERPPCPLDLVYANPTGSVRHGRRGIGQFTIRNATGRPAQVELRFADAWVAPRPHRFTVRPISATLVLLDLDGARISELGTGTHERPLTVLIDGWDYTAQVPIEVKGGWW